MKKLVSVKDYNKRQGQQVKESDFFELFTYVSLGVVEVFLSGADESKKNIRDVKKAVNKFKEFLRLEVNKEALKHHDASPEHNEKMHEAIKLRIEDLTLEFMKKDLKIIN